MRKRIVRVAIAVLAVVVGFGGGEAALSASPGDGYVDWPMGSLDPTGELVLGHGLYVMQNFANANPRYQNRLHAGVDISWGNDLESHRAAGMTVYAAADGRVKCVEEKIRSWPGRVVVLEHALPDGTNVYSLYGHLNDPWVGEGQIVARGEALGSVLDQADLSHLHFEVRDFPYWSDAKDFGGTDRPEYERAPTPDNDVICAGRGYKPRGNEAMPFLKDYGWRDPIAFYYSSSHRPPYPRPVVTTPQRSLTLYRFARTDAEVIGRVPRATRVPAERVASRRSANPTCRDRRIFDRWYRVTFEGQTGFIQGFVCNGWRSALNVGEPARLGPDWQPPPGEALLEYLFDDREAFFTRRVVPNSGRLGDRFDGSVWGDAGLVLPSPAPRTDYAIDLDGDSAYVEIARSGLFYRTAFAAEAMIWRRANEDEDAVLGKWYGEDQWLLTVYPGGSGKAIFSVRLEDGSYQTAEYPIPEPGYLGTWVHIAATYEPGRIGLYWRGRLVAERRFGGRMARGGSPIHIGDAGSGTWWSRFRGRIDKVRVWRLGN